MGSADLPCFRRLTQSRVTNEMFIEAGLAVADQVPSELLKESLLMHSFIWSDKNEKGEWGNGLGAVPAELPH
jgi:hypothetical protein